MDEQDQIVEVVGLIYEAAVEPRRWPEALSTLADCLGSVGATLLFGDTRSAAAAIRQSKGISPEDFQRYNDYYALQDIRLQAALHQPVGRVVTNANLIPRRELETSEFYNDFLVPANMSFVIGSVLLRANGAFASLGIHRPSRSGEFNQHEIRLFSEIVPHLQRAIAIHRRLDQAELRSAAGLDALDRLTAGVILLDAQGRVTVVNRAARAILDRKDGLTLSHDELHACRPALTRELRGLIHETITTGAGKGLGAGGALALPRPSAKRPLSVLVTPMRAAEMPMMPVPMAAVAFLSDPEKTAETAPEVLQSLYSLTPAEARLAALLAAGHTVAEAADALQIRTLTARTQLKSIFLKTGTNRQSDLIRLMMTTPACVAAG